MPSNYNDQKAKADIGVKALQSVYSIIIIIFIVDFKKINLKMN